MSESFKKAIKQLVNFNKVYRNSFIEEIPEGENEAPAPQEEYLKHIQGREDEAPPLTPKWTSSSAKNQPSQRPSTWEAKSDEEKKEMLTKMLDANKERKLELEKTMKSLDEKSMFEELSKTEVALFTKVDDELSQLAEHKKRVEDGLEQLTVATQ